MKNPEALVLLVPLNHEEIWGCGIHGTLKTWRVLKFWYSWYVHKKSRRFNTYGIFKTWWIWGWVTHGTLKSWRVLRMWYSWYPPDMRTWRVLRMCPEVSSKPLDIYPFYSHIRIPINETNNTHILPIILVVLTTHFVKEKKKKPPSKLNKLDNLKHFNLLWFIGQSTLVCVSS